MIIVGKVTALIYKTSLLLSITCHFIGNLLLFILCRILQEWWLHVDRLLNLLCSRLPWWSTLVKSEPASWHQKIWVLLKGSWKHTHRSSWYRPLVDVEEFFFSLKATVDCWSVLWSLPVLGGVVTLHIMALFQHCFVSFHPIILD